MLPSDVCPTEDALRALLEQLVDPLVPAKPSNRDIPSPLQQQKLAKQVHAVVILYNYYHRKQCPELEFLRLLQFCKLVVILRPALLAYMDCMKISDGSVSHDPEKQLSLTEKTIMDACDICFSLDASKETPSIEGWPVSKVTVLLVDSQKENCWLVFGSLTEGVWCMIEKNVDESSQNAESTVKRKRITKRPLRDDPGVDEDALQRLAFLAVKEAAGIDMLDLLILESHVVYSLSKEKSACRFYIMQCNKPPNAKVSPFPVKDIIDRLQGPLITGSANNWFPTSVVENFHLLPYVGILWAWFSRKGSPDSSQSVKANLGTVNFKQADSEVEMKASIKRSHESGTIEGTGKKANSFDTAVPRKNNEGNCIKGQSCDLSVVQDMDVHVVSLPTEDKRTEVSRVIQVKSLQEKKIYSIDRALLGRDSVSKQGESVQSVLQNVIPEVNGEKNAVGKSICHSTSVNDERIPTEDRALFIHRGHSDAFDKVHAVLASRESDLSKTALAILLKKRADLSLQLRKMEDEIALCDKNIHIIQNGGEDALAVKLECVIDASCNAQLASLNHENSHLTPYANCKALSKVTQMEKNCCQELDDICTANKWILPSYCVSPCDAGRFIATVTVKCTEFEISTTGDPRHAPYDARESAADRMLGKLMEV
ncbi:uncharacterized protein LOC116199403 isoform X3 [Punica granatum]|uniref:Uncharacterized protein LOC116199403 isoform X3 n=1 Tax=Punica granatum TaxID=22663 RepID=A0A6P8D273_PUNGR|nr:uncharacterized protein LOC116199403 isoform X3 [Punica granatum]